ncbi:hypothetical protein [Paraburkholderia sacchari]|nr:hypothetical protein [Paraburkholderia sacchari]
MNESTMFASSLTGQAHAAADRSERALVEVGNPEDGQLTFETH